MKDKEYISVPVYLFNGVYHDPIRLFRFIVWMGVIWKMSPEQLKKLLRYDINTEGYEKIHDELGKEAKDWVEGKRISNDRKTVAVSVRVPTIVDLCKQLAAKEEYDRQEVTLEVRRMIFYWALKSIHNKSWLSRPVSADHIIARMAGYRNYDEMVQYETDGVFYNLTFKSEKTRSRFINGWRDDCKMRNVHFDETCRRGYRFTVCYRNNGSDNDAKATE